MQGAIDRDPLAEALQLCIHKRRKRLIHEDGPGRDRFCDDLILPAMGQDQKEKGGRFEAVANENAPSRLGWIVQTL